MMQRSGGQQTVLGHRRNALASDHAGPMRANSARSKIRSKRIHDFNDGLTLIFKPEGSAILFAQMTGLQLLTERQCRHAIRAHWPVGSRPDGDRATAGLRW